ncbi:MAG: CorA family divalent cation transporter [archaeon]|nr:CorA family divalent cation transporter [archaeon]
MEQATELIQKNGESLEKHAVCVALLNNGKTLRKTAQSVKEFEEIFSEAGIVWINYWAQNLGEDMQRVASELGFSDALIQSIMKNSISGYEDFDSELALMLPAVSVEGFDVTANPVMIFIKQNIVLTIHSSKIRRFINFTRYADRFFKKMPKKLSINDKITLLLIRIIDENNGRNFDYLRQIELQGDELSKFMLDPTTKREMLGPEIYKMKHALISYLDAMWATIDVINNLRYGDAELITDDEKLLQRMTILSADVNTQIGLSEHMTEVLASGLEVLQSIYNNQLQILNNRLTSVMTYLTILGTAVLVPNTLATILSNPAFNLQPKDAGWYIALLVISTVGSTYAAWWGVKRKGLFSAKE